MSRKTVIDKEIMKDVIREYQNGTGPAELSRIYKISPVNTLLLAFKSYRQRIYSERPDEPTEN